MAAATDKARFYLEQSIPELRELERKGVLSKSEISNIIKKRSDFEHKLNGPGARSTDFARYAEFEINLEALRKKRFRRIGIRAGQFKGNRRVFHVLDRATKKFHGDLGLWMQYLGECRRQKSYNKINEVLSNVIRMHPTKPEVWIYAASYSMEEQGDMVEARSYMQRGLRFCRGSQDMWLTYARLELLYITKIYARQEVLGMTGKSAEKANAEEDDEDADMIALPSLTANDLNGETTHEHNGSQQLESLSLTPALSGAIPMAIFDAAAKHFDAEFGSRFFDMVLDFRLLPCSSKILDHVVSALRNEYPNSSSTLDCYIRQPIVQISTKSVEYPGALAIAFARSKEAVTEHPSFEIFVKVITWLIASLNGNHQEDIAQALLSMLLRVLKLGVASDCLDSGKMINLLGQQGGVNPNVLTICLDVWSGDEDLKCFATAKIGREATKLVLS